jgi:hemolysin activation/secretion protein
MGSRMKSSSVALATALASLAITVTAQAQTAPDAGALRQQIERLQAQPLPGKVPPAVAPAPEAQSTLSAVTVVIKSFKFVGNTLLTTEQLSLVLQAYLNKPQNFSQLQQAAVDITNAYRDAGWLVRAYLPKQDLSSGVLTIQIVEAVFGDVTLDGPAAARVKFAQIQRIFQQQQASGQPVNLPALDRALLLADDLPGVAVVGSLIAGQKDGETGLNVKLTDEPLTVGDASLDNTGNRSTGSARLSANLYLNSALGRGDLLSACAVHTRGSDYLRLGATAPVGSDGWRVGANASTLTYHVISPEFTALNSRGNSGSYGLETSYPLIRARARNLYLSLAFDQKNFHNESNATVQSDYRSRVISFGLSANVFDSMGGGGANSASLTLIKGNTALGSLNASENASLGGGFTKLHYALARQQAITPDASLYAALSGQHASKTLDSSEKFTLGGSGGVRAYPASEGSGSRGQLVNLELRWRLPQDYALTAFYDWGSISNPESSPGASYYLHGVGLALTWQSSHGFNLKTIWARRLGNNPNPTATGMDQDGSININRWWFTASLPF